MHTMSTSNETDPRRNSRSYVSGYLSPERANERTIGLASLMGMLRAALRRRS